MHCTIGTAGHVDHGKTTLIMALTGIDTDGLAEEKRRGLSIDLGFAAMETSGSGTEEPLNIGLVDVPGHERFMRNMLAGATGVDLLLLVVAADDGVMPQTVTHLTVAHLLGIERAVVVITKSGIVSPERLAEVRREVTTLIEPTSISGSAMIDVDSLSGEGISELRAVIYKNCLEIKRRTGGPYFRLPVDRSFAIKGFGAVATGTIASGSVHIEDELSLYPSGTVVRVRGIESLKKKVEESGQGARAALNLKGVAHDNLDRGAVVADKGLVSFYSTSLRRGKGLIVDCKFEFTEAVSASSPIKNGLSLKAHHQCAESTARLRFLDQKTVKGPGIYYGRLYLKEPLLAMRGDRIILIDTSTGTVVGGAELLMPYFTRELGRGFATTDFSLLDSPKPVDKLTAIMGSTKAWVARRGLAYMFNVDQSLLADLGRDFTILGDYIFRSKALEIINSRIVDILRVFHSKNKSASGMAEADLAAALSMESDFSLSSAAFKAIIERLSGCGSVKKVEGLLVLPGHMPKLSGREAEIVSSIERLFVRGMVVIRSEELRLLGFGSEDTRQAVDYLIKNGRLVRLTKDHYLSADEVGKAFEILRATLKEGDSVRVSEFRDRLGCGRKLAIEILEYFDREGITIRCGDDRFLREI